MSTEVSTIRVSKPAPKKRRPRKDKEKFANLKNLECFPELDVKVKAGISIDEIARWLQDDLYQMTDIQLDSLKRQLTRYKASLPPAELLKATEEPLFIREAIQKMKRGINEIDELEKLYLFQLQRISRDAETERKINKLFKGTNKEIELATSLLEKSLKLKMELGLLNKSPNRLEVGGMIGHVPLMPKSLEEDKSADKTMTRMGLLASKLFKAIEDVSIEEESIIDAECEEVKH